jgi:hypothetical protein
MKAAATKLLCVNMTLTTGSGGFSAVAFFKVDRKTFALAATDLPPSLGLRRAKGSRPSQL